MVVSREMKDRMVWRYTFHLLSLYERYRAFKRHVWIYSRLSVYLSQGKTKTPEGVSEWDVPEAGTYSTYSGYDYLSTRYEVNVLRFNGLSQSQLSSAYC